MNRCATCKHWKAPRRADWRGTCLLIQNAYDVDDECEAEKPVFGDAVRENEGDFLPPATFGCVLHEAREGE